MSEEEIKIETAYIKKWIPVLYTLKQIVQEGLTNIEKHTQATQTELSIVSNIFSCLGTRDRVQAAIIAIRNGLGVD